MRFITLLGRDTIAVEQFDRTATSIVGEVVLRAPRTRIYGYDVVTTPAHRLVSALLTIRTPQSAGGTEVPSSIRVTARGDSLAIERTRGDSVARVTIAARGQMIPWFSAQSVAQWDLVVRAAAAKPGDSVEVAGFHFNGSKPFRVYVSRFERDSARVDYESFDIATHLGLGASGRVAGLDGTPSTIKIRAVPVPALDLPRIAEQFGREDAAGHAAGALSPRDTARASVADAAISVEYGRPSRRGRAVWGGLLPATDIWRLGANAATTLKTSRSLEFADGINVSPGSYTLWLIPGSSSGTLIINAETGQWGTQYKAARDIARFPVRFEAIASGTPEQFTTRIVADLGSQGRLLFEWDGRRYVVPFRVKPS